MGTGVLYSIYRNRPCIQHSLAQIPGAGHSDDRLGSFSGHMTPSKCAAGGHGDLDPGFLRQVHQLPNRAAAAPFAVPGVKGYSVFAAVVLEAMGEQKKYPVRGIPLDFTPERPMTIRSGRKASSPEILEKGFRTW